MLACQAPCGVDNDLTRLASVHRSVAEVCAVGVMAVVVGGPLPAVGGQHGQA
jgi:hypothetical protein